jgi:hypothetical protein
MDSGGGPIYHYRSVASTVGRSELFVIKFGYLLLYGPCIFIVLTN